jgi:hypothetical protein
LFWTFLSAGGTLSQRPVLSDDKATIFATASYDTGRLSSAGTIEWVRRGPSFNGADPKLSPDQMYLYTLNPAKLTAGEGVGHLIRKLEADTGGKTS